MAPAMLGAVPPATGTAALLEACLPPHLAGNDAARALCLRAADVCAALISLAAVPSAPIEPAATAPRVRTEHLPGGRRTALSWGL